MDTKTLADFDRSIKTLRKTKLARSPEFNNMILASERFHRDAKLASLTRKDQNQTSQMFQDGQFFSILLGMLTEVSRSSGLKQRDDLRKVYHWYQMNKDVLHCRPHFQSVSTPPNQKPPELKFSPEVIKYYSLPMDKRKTKQVEFVEESTESVPSSEIEDIGKNHQRGSSGPRPVTAPPSLHRPKVENTLSKGRKSWRGQQYFIEESGGLSIGYINKHLTPKKYMAALERPSSALAVVRQYQQSLSDPNLDHRGDDGSSDGRLSPSPSSTGGSQTSIPGIEVDASGRETGVAQVTDHKETTSEDEEQQTQIEESTNNDATPGDDTDERTEEETGSNQLPAPTGVTDPVARHSFADEEIYGDGDPPDEKKYQLKKIEISIPAVGDEGSSIASQANLQKWHEYQQSHSSLHSNIAMATNDPGDFQSEGMMVEMPELITNQVIAEFAERTGPANVQGQSHYDQSQSLEDFYKASEKFSPTVNPKKPILKRQPSGQADQSKRKVSDISDDRTDDLKARYVAQQDQKALNLESVVDLAGPVSDQMVLEKESQQELVEPRLRHRAPAGQIPPPRPHTALGHSSMTHISIPDGRARTSPASTPRSSRDSQESPRTGFEDTLHGYALNPQYDVHFRRRQRPLTAPTQIPHAVQRTPIRPDSTRYRSKSASPRSSLRTAGSTSGGGRPWTSSSNKYTERTSIKPTRNKIRVPGAASHSSTTIHPLTISAMMSVRHLGGTSLKFRESLTPRASRYWNNEDVPDDLPPNLEFMSISRPVTVYEGKLKDESNDIKEPSSESKNPDTTQPEEFPDWTSPHDSIEGLVQLGRARSERGAGDADSQDGGSLGGSSERGLSPEPADLSDVDDEMTGFTPREGAEDWTPREDWEEEGKDEERGLEVASGGTKPDDVKMSEDLTKEDLENETTEGLENVPSDDSRPGEQSEDVDKDEAIASKDTSLEEDEGEEDGVREDAENDRNVIQSGDVLKEVEGDGNSEGKEASSEEDRVDDDDGEVDGNMEHGAVDDNLKENGGGESGEDKVESDEAVDKMVKDGNVERQEDGKSFGDGGETVRPNSKAFSIFESLDDEDYFEPPLVHLDDRPHPTVRSPQSVIPRVRDPNGQLVDAQLEVVTYQKPLTPRDEDDLSRAVTICGTRRRRSPKSKRESGAEAGTYLLTEEEPSPEEQAARRIKAEVTKKPLWERTWDRYDRDRGGYVFDKQVSVKPEVVSGYRLTLAGFEDKRNSGNGAPLSDLQQPEKSATEDNSFQKIVARRPQTPKKFEVLEPRPFKPVTDEWKGRPVPEVGSELNEEAEMRAFEMKRAAKQAVEIGQLFSKKADKTLKKIQQELEWSRWEKRWEEADAAERNHLRHLIRKDEAILKRSEVIEGSWEEQYISQRQQLKQDKKKERKDEKKKRKKLAKKEKAYLNRIGPSLDIWDVFREGRRGTTKAQRKAAAIMIQKHVRGWLARRKFEKIKQKSRVHATSYGGFTKYYSKLMHRVARWHGVKSPTIHINLKEVDEFMDKKRYFENVFARRAFPRRTIEYQDLGNYFKECDLYPTQREMYNAVLGVTRKTPDNPHMALTEEQVAETAFMIYVPDGSGLDKAKTRQSTWMNPLIDGKEANKFLGSSEYHSATLSKSMQLVFTAHKERMEREEAEKRKAENGSEVKKDVDDENLTEEERKRLQLEEWIKKEREREKIEDEKRNRPIREGELVTNYQLGEEGLLSEMAGDD
ncbi:uncharacterized protein [Apostichopus japonicus]|uniref:uncharacterized protein isoform X2 n=1 Tax=Stichopus japonicus TaxID=307972 RepID=UPI003AB6A37C